MRGQGTEILAEPTHYTIIERPYCLQYFEKIIKFVSQGLVNEKLSASTYVSTSKGHLSSIDILYRRSNKSHPLHELISLIDIYINDPYFGAELIVDPEKNASSLGANYTFGNGLTFKANPCFSNQLPQHVSSAAAHQLKDVLLLHKRENIAHILGLVNKMTHGWSNADSIIVDNQQLVAGYPALMVRLNPNFFYHQEMVTKSKKQAGYFNKEYTKLLTHLLMSFINKNLNAMGVGHYINRRQSYGFLTPTAADTGGSIRISLGLVPNNVWNLGVAAGIIELNATVIDLWEKNYFSLADNHCFPTVIYKNKRFDNYAHRVFYQHKDNIRLAFEALKKTETQVAPAIPAPGHPGEFSENSLKIYQLLHDFYSVLNETPSKTIKQANSHAAMERLEEAMNTYKVNVLRRAVALKEIPITSDSDSENESLNAHKKYFTPTGMSALACPLFAFHVTLHEGLKKTYYCLTPYAYFELPSWKYRIEPKAIGVLKSNAEMTPTECFKHMEDSDVIYVDNNPCITGSFNWISPQQILEHFQNNKHQDHLRMLVVDVTSATKEEMNRLVTAWKNSSIHLLCFASSGLKNNQGGLDMAQYGENKLLVNRDLIKKLGSGTVHRVRELLTQYEKSTRGKASVVATTIRRDVKYASNVVKKEMSVFFKEDIKTNNLDDKPTDILGPVVKRRRPTNGF